MGLSEDEETEGYWQHELELQARRQWECIVILLAAAERPLQLSERLRLAKEMGVIGMYVQVLDEEQKSAKDK